MKLIIEEYGRIIIAVILGSLIFLYINGTFLDEIRNHIVVSDSIETDRNQENEFYRIPTLEGLEQDGEPLALKVQAGGTFYPIQTTGIIQVKAYDEMDGDITDQIKVYSVETEDEKEKMSLIKGNLNLSEANQQYILEYVIENSAGYQNKKRISILTYEAGGKV